MSYPANRRRGIGAAIKSAIGSHTTYKKEKKAPMSVASSKPTLSWYPTKKQPTGKTYKDKGYKPSSGKGVGM